MTVRLQIAEGKIKEYRVVKCYLRRVVTVLVSINTSRNVDENGNLEHETKNVIIWTVLYTWQNPIGGKNQESLRF